MNYAELLVVTVACQCNENGTIDDGECNELVSMIVYSRICYSIVHYQVHVYIMIYVLPY